MWARRFGFVGHAHRVRAAIAAAILLTTAVAPQSSVAALTIGPIERASVLTGGGQANDGGYGLDDPVVSGDGSFIVFDSYATNLVAGDTNGAHDIFRHMRGGSTIRVSVDSSGAQSQSGGQRPAVDATGNLVAFVTQSPLDPFLDAGSTFDVYLRDVSGGNTGLVSVNQGGTAAGGDQPSISADGKRVAFSSCGTDLVANDLNGHCDVFVRDLSLGTTTLVSVDGAGIQGDGDSSDSAISADGSTVAFYSCATNLVGSADTNGACDVFVRTLPNGPTELISKTTSGVSGNAASGDPGSGRAIDVSGDGRFIVFLSSATDLLGAGGRPGVYLRDRQASGTTRVDPAAGAPLSLTSMSVAISDDAARITFVSYRSDLVTSDTNSQADTFVAERSTGVITRLSVNSSGNEGDGSSYDTAISGDGSTVAFSSLADNLVPNDTNGVFDDFAVGLLSTVPPEATTSACSLQQDQSENDANIQLLQEQGLTAVKLCADLAVNISVMGDYSPQAPGRATLTPGVIPANTLIRSFLVHGDRAYAVTKNGDYLYRPDKAKTAWVTVRFSSGSVLGIIVRDHQLDESDVLGASGTAYPTGLANRGQEVDLLASGNYINKRDEVFWEDARTVKLRLQVGEAMDQIRIITTADGVIDPAGLTYLRLVAPPPSLGQDQFDTERCAPGVPDFNRCNAKDPSELDDLVVMFEQLNQPIHWNVPVAIDIGPGDGVYTRANWAGRPVTSPIAAGTPVYSYIFHSDRLGAYGSFPPGDFVYLPTAGNMAFTFSTDIVGVITTSSRLDATDVAARPGYAYPTAWPDRGADFDLGPGNANDEYIQISGRTIMIRFQVGNGLDEVRVITAAT